jgi:hypothetical protein
VSKRICLFLLGLLLVAGLWLMPVYQVSYAQEETPITETEGSYFDGRGGFVRTPQ